MALNKIQKNHLELMLKWRNNPVVRKNMFNQDVISLADHEKWFARESETENSVWMMYIDKNGEPSGVIYCKDIDECSRHGFWGFYTAPDALPGTGTLMCTEGLDYFFGEIGLNKVNAEVLEGNKKSHGFHKKMGFSIEGVFLEHYKIESVFQSVTRYAIFSREWIRRKRG